VGLAIAAVGIWLSQRWQMPLLDGAASLLIGILLAGVASLLAWQSRGLLIGEGIRPETARAIREIALAQAGVRDVGRVLSMYVGPDDALVTMDLDFDEGTVAADAALALAEVGLRVRERFPMIQRLFIEAGPPTLPQRWSRPDAIRTLPDGAART
jgi:divalent metal cation (Fe/Co/Zn/Cd) transporter